MPSGKLIAIEGIDASGKGTQAALLRDHLLGEGMTVGMLSFPRYGRTFFAEAISRYLNGGFGSLETLDPSLVSLLYAGDRFETRGELETLLSENEVVVLDRYVASNLAHQSARVPDAGRDGFVDWLSRLEYEVYGLPRADLTLLLDISAESSAVLLGKKGRRAYTEARADLHEADSSYMDACRRAYRWLADQEAGGPWVVVSIGDDAGAPRPVEAVHSDVVRAIRATARTGPPRRF